MRVVVIGASNKPDRYSYKAIHNLLAAGHQVLPVHPKLAEVQGLKVSASPEELLPVASGEEIDTVTLYVNADRSSQLAEQILALKPRRIIFNPGAENPGLLAQARSQGIEGVEACTLVMLATGQF